MYKNKTSLLKSCSSNANSLFTFFLLSLLFGWGNTSGYSQTVITDITPNAAAPGNNVTIYGAGFSETVSENTVTFDGTSATVVSASETKLVVTVPDIEPGFADVSVTNENGMVAYPGSFTVLNRKGVAFLSATTNLPGVQHGSSSFGDVDGDGDLDLIITGYNGSAYISILYTNDGNGGFSDSGIALEGVRYSSSSFGDVDGDGDLDLIITGNTGSTSTSTLYTNDGNGGFSDSGIALDGVTSGSSSFGDVDGDGDLDLVITGSQGSAYISILYTNDGNGGFSDSGIALEGVRYSSSSFGDVDGDGDLDLIITGNTGSTITSTLYTNDGNGGFSDSGVSLEGVVYSSSSFGDVDGDGDLDLFVSGYNGSAISTLYTNDGNGNFSDSGIALEGVYYSSSSFGDVDGDGDLDLIFTGRHGSINISKLYTNDGNGSFSDSGIPFEGVYFTSSSFGDVNGDGDLDLLITGNTGSTITSTLYENIEPPFTINKVEPKAAIPGTRVTLYGTGFSPNVNDNMVSFGNTQAVINSASETKLEVTVPDNNPGSYTISIANDDETGEYSGIFTVLTEKDPYFKPAYTGLEGLRYGSSDFEDVDNDGDLDLFVTGTTSSNARLSQLLLNDGEGNFSDAETDIGTSTNTITAWGDIDNDGDRDLFISGVSSTGARKSYLYINNGSGEFHEANSSIENITHGDAEFGDLDNDGDLDLVITGFNTSSQRITKIYLNDGFGDFSYQSDLEGMHYSSLALGDINGDNFLDIQLSGLNNSNVRVSRIYINNGSGGFNNTSSLEGVQYSTSDFIDIDNDADLDLLITGYNSSNQRISKLYINNGSGSYSDSGISLDGVMYGSTAIADIDGNGYQDLLITGYSSSGIRENDLYLNNGTGGIINSGISLEGIQEGDVAFGDIDGDGDLDLFISGLSTAGQYISKLYENDVPPFTITSLSSEAAAPGSEITLYGYGFHPNENENIVTLGPYQAVIIYSDTTLMRVTVPDIEPGNYRISMSNDKGTANYADNFTVLNQKRAYFEASDNELIDVYFSASNFGDLDSDGDQDLIISGYNSTSGDDIGFYLNDGAGAFTETENSFTAMRYGDIEFADVNNDGHLDVLVAGYSAGASTKLYINDGEGNFTDTNHAIENFYYGAISVGDVDADGDLDLLISGTNSSNLRISKLYLNDGIGGFSLTDVSLEGIYQGSNAFSDIDSDGDLDILITGYNSSNVAVTRLYKNDGNANFTLATTSLDNVYRNSINFHDIDGDGDNDLLLTGQNSSNIRISTLYLNDGNGNFTDSGQSFDGVMYSSSNIADVDGDGDYDVVISGNGNTGSITKIYLNDGSGQFNDSQLGFEGVQYGATNFSDIDGDGDLDFLLSGYTPSGTPITKLYNNITPPGPSNLVATVNDNSIDLNWSPSPLTNIGGHNVYRSTSHISEVSNEWKLNTELLTGTTYTDINLQENTQYFYYVTAVDSLTGEESVLSNEAVANYKLKSIFATSVAGNIPGGSLTLFGTHLSSNPADFTVQFGGTSATVLNSSQESVTATIPDINPGNYPVTVTISGVDLILPNPITVIEDTEDESGYFQDAVVLSDNAEGIKNLTATDIDQDNNFDILASYFNSGTISWIKNNGDSEFESEREISSAIAGASDAFTADLNSDGDLDVVAVSYNNNSVILFENNGSESFTQHSVITSTANGALSALATDVDMDGDLDIVVASELDNDIVWFSNDGTGNFGAENAINLSASRVRNIHAADINGDGYMDLLSASEADDTIRLYVNNGDGTFASEVIISNTADGAQDIKTGDLDDDGHLDIISASNNDNKIAWYKNNGDNTFEGDSIITDSFESVFRVQIADLNGDSKQDVIASSDNGLITWYANNGDGSFNSPDTVTTSASGETTIQVADFTDNGTLDILAGSNGTGEILLFKNVDIPPAPPGGLTISQGIGSATLSWDANTEPDILGYDVLRASGPDEEFISLLSDLQEGTSFTDTGLQNGRTYYYKVVVFDLSLTPVQSEVVDIIAVSTQISGVSPEAGTGGTRVKISGVGFSNVLAQNTVTFNDTEVDVLEADSLSLIVEVPADLSGMQEITVTSEEIEYVHPSPFLVLIPNDGEFSTPQSQPGFGGNGNMVSADVDHDGDMDLMITQPESNRFILYLSDNRDPFSSSINFNTSGVSPKKVRAMNVCGSNYPDFIFLTQVNNQFRVMKNTSSETTDTGLFDFINITADNNTPEDIFPADMDNDGITDVVIASSGDNKINWYKNLSTDENVAFGEENVITTSANGVSSIVAGDFNNDNHIDILSANENAIVLYQNTGDGNFSSLDIRNDIIPEKVVGADLNNDGSLDILSASSDGVIVYINDGSGGFSDPVTLEENEALDVTAADINGNGFQDVIASFENNLLLLFINNGEDGFSDAYPISENEAAIQDIIAYDIQGDGRLDLAIRSAADENISVFRNMVVEGLAISNFNAGNNTISTNDDIELHFTGSVSSIPDFDGIISTALTMQNIHGETFTPTSYTITDSILTISQNSFYASDTLTIDISSEQVRINSDGEFYIDANNNGENDSGDDYYESPQFYTGLIGDYNSDFYVDFDDLVLFSDGWRNNDYLYETAPLVYGNQGYPSGRVHNNNSFDIEDLVMFIRSWNISQELAVAEKTRELLAKENAKNTDKEDAFTKPGKDGLVPNAEYSGLQNNSQHKSADTEIISDSLDYISYKKEASAREYLTTESKHEVTYTFSVTHPDSVKAVSLVLDYDETKLSVSEIQGHELFKSNSGNHTIFISNVDSTSGIAVLNIANFGSLNPLDEKRAASITFKSIKDQDSEMLIKADIRASGKPNLLQVAKKSVQVKEDLPQSFELSQNYPNPFNPTTTIRYELAEPSRVSLDIYDILGRKVESLINQNELKAGYYKTNWNASRYASGMYIYILNIRTNAGKKHTLTKKMIMIK